MHQNKISLGFSIASTVRHIAIPAIVLGLDGTFVCANSLARDLLGLPPDGDDTPHPLPQLLRGEATDQFALFVASALDDPAPAPVTVNLRHRSSKTQFALSPLTDDSNGLLGVLCQVLPQNEPPNYLVWKQAVESGGHGLWSLDVTTGIATYSDEWFRMRGRSRNDPGITQLSNVTARLHPDDVETVETALNGILQNPADTFSYQFRERHADGHYIWIVSRGRITARDANGVGIRAAGSDTEITKFRDTEATLAELTERELRWQVAIESADQGVWDHNIAAGRRFVSDTWRTLRGISVSEDIDDSLDAWLTQIHPDDLARVQDEIERQDSGETDTVNYQYRQRHRDGHWVWILSRGRVVARNPDGTPARVIGIDTDITELKRVETDHSRMVDRLRVAMQAADMGRWEFDIHEGTAFWDDRLKDMFGVPDAKNPMPSEYWGTLIHPDDRARTLGASDAAVKARRDITVDYRILRPDGQIRHVRSRALVVYEDGQPVRYVGVNIDVTEHVLREQELEKARAQLEYESRHDALTGLTNRRGLDDVQADNLARMPHNRLAVLHFDLDNFKQINDTLGHAAGDAVLVHAAQVLRSHAQDQWVAARVGGDEFVMMVPDAPDDAALGTLAHAIISDLATPVIYQGQPCNFGVSIGIAIAGPDQPADDTLFVNADLALYAAKKEGRGSYRFFAPAMKQAADTRKASFDALQSGLENDEIICHYQPQFDARTLELSGVEALVRWNSPAHGLVMPDEFLSTAEEMGIIADLDALVFRRARADLKAWQDMGFDVPRISVNVSAARLSDPSLGQRLCDMELPRNKFSFELLESAFLDTYGDALEQNLKIIKSLGIEIEVDDFGTGHASIVSLLRVSPHRLKIDRQLVDPIVNSVRQRRLIETIINIGHMQGVAVVAEGVETAAHARVLQALGCDDLQGYALGRPQPFDQLAELLQELRNNDGRLTLAA